MNSRRITAYPANRDWAFPDVLDISSTPAIEAAWSRSTQTIHQMQAALEAANIDGLSSVAASGSLGRMEVHENSDCDLIVILNDDVCLDSPDAIAIYDTVWECLVPLNLKRPNAVGIYGTPTSTKQLHDPSSLGKIEDDPSVFGKRIQLLIDSQPICGQLGFEATIRTIIERYSSGLRSGSRNWHYLMNDAVRYYRSLCVYYEWDQRDNIQKWRTRNLKLRYSRLLNHAGILFTLAESARGNVVNPEFVFQRLRLTPLERVASVYSRLSETGFDCIASSFDRYLQCMGAPAFQASLGESSTGHTEFEGVIEDSRGIVQELCRVLLTKHAEWNARFFECLLF